MSIKCRLILMIFLLSVQTSSSLSYRRHRLINSSENKNTKSQNIGTVLFDREDCEKKCWSNDELILIISRSVFQDMLPQASMIDYHQDEYIDLFIEYINICLESVQRLTQKKLKRLVTKALADTLAGYLHVYVLPITKRSYYAGNIPFQKSKKLFDLYDEFKTFLRTDGDGWNHPKIVDLKMEISKIDLTGGKSKNDCAGLILYHGHGGSVSIPMPILDDLDHPTSIALPFETDNFCSLFSEKSAFVLVKYFAAGSKCLASTSSVKELEHFHQQFYNWIHQSVNEHLLEEVWYPAFGGVLKIVVTIEAKDLGSSPRQKENHPVVNSHLPPGQKKIEAHDSGHHRVIVSNTESCELNKIAIIVIACILLIWVLLGISLVTWRLIKGNSSDDTIESPDQNNYRIDTKYENEKFPLYGNSACSENGFLKKLKSPWRKKSPCKCSEDSDDDEEDDVDFTTDYSSNDYKNRQKHADFVMSN